MTPEEKIKVLLLLKKKTIAGMACKYATRLPKKQRNLESLRKQFSMCVNGKREIPRIQQFIAEELEEPYEQLFGQAAAPKAA